MFFLHSVFLSLPLFYSLPLFLSLSTFPLYFYFILFYFFKDKVVSVQAFNPSSWEADVCELKDSLVYIQPGLHGETLSPTKQQ
jgi:hypothetical protein